jgi:hypothetical protein
MAKIHHSVQRLQMVENPPSTKLHELADQAGHSRLVAPVVLARPKVAAAVDLLQMDLEEMVEQEHFQIFPALRSSMAAAAHQWALGHLLCMAQLLAAVEFLLLTAQM